MYIYLNVYIFVQIHTHICMICMVHDTKCVASCSPGHKDENPCPEFWERWEPSLMWWIVVPGQKNVSFSIYIRIVVQYKNKTFHKGLTYFLRIWNKTLIDYLSSPVVATKWLTYFILVLFFFLCCVPHWWSGEAPGPLLRKTLKAYSNNKVDIMKRKPMILKQLSK